VPLRDSIVDHLRLLHELGIEHVSRDSAWISRATEPRRAIATSAPGAEVAEERERVGILHVSTDDDNAGDAGHQLREIRDDIGDCTRCKLHRLGRTQVVFGVGNPRARLMFVGEAPGGDEDIQGIPFVGRAGQLLTKIIEAIGLKREDVYIANVIKCRPPGNRNPEPDEVATCEPFLFRQIDAIGPRVIVALGTFAVQALLRTREPISRLRGQVFLYRGARLVPTFHPAFLLRSPDKKRDAWEDMKKVMAILREEK
jgi:uracil-DNA glycosylase family 4